jgi:uncharacterized protein (DUF1501 family)
MNRRALLKSLFFGSGGSPALVVVFLRGGADGLSMVVPHFESEYYRLRPTLAQKDFLKLDERFGLNSAFKPLEPFFDRLAVVHAVGSDDATRSHFEAQDLMEHAGHPEEGVSGGWLARHLRAKVGTRGAIASVSIAPTLPESLRGAPSACAIESIDEVALRSPTPAFTEALRVLYQSDASAMGRVARSTFALLERVNSLRDARAETYPSTQFGRALAEIARLLKADVGLEVACVDLGGWDTHFVQGAVLSSNIAELAGGLAAFAKDLGPRLDDAIVVVMTEFGRRAYENESLGTDHGRASVMFAMGGSVKGGRVIADWPGLKSLEGPGDLRVTIDYRDILAEIVERGLGNSRVDKVFPGYIPKRRGLIAS